MLVMILVGYLVKDRIKTSEDYLVAGRSFGLFFNSATLVACFIGGSMLIATPGRIYSVGIWDDLYLSGGALFIVGGGLLCLLLVGACYLGPVDTNCIIDRTSVWSFHETDRNTIYFG